MKLNKKEEGDWLELLEHYYNHISLKEPFHESLRDSLIELKLKKERK